jgi:hypothetical protein
MFPLLNGSLILMVGMAQVHADKDPSKSGTRYSNCAREASFGVVLDGLFENLKEHYVDREVAQKMGSDWKKMS